jgi:fructose 1,6-bisphosphate aldolase/phosphatase
MLTTPVDLFADPLWNAIRDQVTRKAVEMRQQGFFGPAMLDISELEYGGISARLQRLDKEFVVAEHTPAAEAAATTR